MRYTDAGKLLAKTKAKKQKIRDEKRAEKLRKIEYQQNLPREFWTGSQADWDLFHTVQCVNCKAKFTTRKSLEAVPLGRTWKKSDWERYKFTCPSCGHTHKYNVVKP